VFHVSLLRKHHGQVTQPSTHLPLVSDTSTILPEPEVILDRRIIHKGQYQPKSKILVSGRGLLSRMQRGRMNGILLRLILLPSLWPRILKWVGMIYTLQHPLHIVDKGSCCMLHECEHEDQVAWMRTWDVLKECERGTCCRKWAVSNVLILSYCFINSIINLVMQCKAINANVNFNRRYELYPNPLILLCYSSPINSLYHYMSNFFKFFLKKN